MRAQTDLVKVSTDGVLYRDFIDGINSDSSKEGYEDSLIRYCRFHKISGIDNLLLVTDKRTVESQIINYIKSLRSKK